MNFKAFTTGDAEGVWLPETPSNLVSIQGTLDWDYVSKVRSYAWAGLLDETSKDPNQTLAQYLEEHYAKSSAYLDFVDSEYKKIMNFFDEKFSQ